MGIVAIHTGHVTRAIHWILSGIVDTGSQLNGMGAEFVEFRHEVFGGYISVMAGVTIIFSHGLSQQALMSPGGMRHMAIFTTVARHGFVRGGWPRIQADSVPGLGRGRVGGSRPARAFMALQTKRR